MGTQWFVKSVRRIAFSHFCSFAAISEIEQIERGEPMRLEEYGIYEHNLRIGIERGQLLVAQKRDDKSRVGFLLFLITAKNCYGYNYSDYEKPIGWISQVCKHKNLE